jgi:DNA-binding PadR family transcriptional regulator
MGEDRPELSREDIQKLLTSNLDFKKKIENEEENNTVIFKSEKESISDDLLEKLNEVYPFESFSITPKSKAGVVYNNIVLRLADSYEESFFAEEPTSVCKWCGDTVKEKIKESHQESCVHNPENKGNKSVQLKNKRIEAIKTEYDRLKDNNNLPDTEEGLEQKILTNLKDEGILPENYKVDEEILEEELREFRGLKQNDKCDCPVTNRGAIRHEDDCEYLNEQISGSGIEIELDKSQKPNEEIVEEEEKQDTNITLSDFNDLTKEEQHELVVEKIKENQPVKGRDVIDEVWGYKVETKTKKYNKIYNIINKLKREGFVEKKDGYQGEYSVTSKGRDNFFSNEVEEQSSTEQDDDEDKEYGKPAKKTGYSKHEWKDLRDVTSSEVVLHHLADGPKTPEELEELIFESSEEVNGCYKIKRLLRDYIDGVIGKGSSKVDDDKYFLNKNVREQLNSDDDSLSQLIRSNPHGSVPRLECLECEQIFASTNDAKKHRRNKGHFNWEKGSMAPTDWQNNGDEGEWKKALV